jgi:hypothetical protein
VADEEKGEKKRGPKGGIKHTPGRGHATKSEPAKKRRISKRLAKRHAQRREKERTEKERLDRLPEEVKKLLEKKPKPRRPKR